jgi:hypothetical protein
MGSYGRDIWLCPRSLATLISRRPPRRNGIGD